MLTSFYWPIESAFCIYEALIDPAYVEYGHAVRVKEEGFDERCCVQLMIMHIPCHDFWKKGDFLQFCMNKLTFIHSIDRSS